MTAQPSFLRSRKFQLAVVAAMVVLGALIWWVVGLASSSQGSTPPQAQLPDQTAMGVVELQVNDLSLMRSYYEDAVGLEVFDESETEVTLGLDTALLRLVVTTQGEPVATYSEAGLYHSAILYEHHRDLANVLLNIATVAPQSYQGSADHAVSLAFYFVDPEGNGLELYVDTPREQWEWIDGEVRMGAAPLDPNRFMQDYVGISPQMPTNATMGHVHLKVGNLDEAEAFYADVLGFAVTARSQGALFYAAEGYHHHLATNTWLSDGAGERSNETGLGSLSILLPDAAAIAEVESRLATAGYEFERNSTNLSTQDPWGNLVVFVSP